MKITFETEILLLVADGFWIVMIQLETYHLEARRVLLPIMYPFLVSLFAEEQLRTVEECYVGWFKCTHGKIGCISMKTTE
jgi:hypothetical protein